VINYRKVLAHFEELLIEVLEELFLKLAYLVDKDLYLNPVILSLVFAVTS
jgi:hypothetical protein